MEVTRVPHNKATELRFADDVPCGLNEHCLDVVGGHKNLAIFIRYHNQS